MSERLPVELYFFGEPFDRQAVVHILRHVAMRAGWTIKPKAHNRIIYATTEDTGKINASEKDLVILSSSAVKKHLNESKEPFPFETIPEGRLPFPHPKWREFDRQGWIAADVIAGALGVLNLWFESQTQSEKKNDWILFADDWWQKAGWQKPEPIVDQWLGTIIKTASALSWQQCQDNPQSTVLLTHDVDYLPSPFNRGFPRFLRSLARQAVTRKRLDDTVRNVYAYGKSFIHELPYFDFEKIVAGELARGACSSFQFISRRGHRSDPAYDLNNPYFREALRILREKDFEVCLHGSYRAGDEPLILAEEKKTLENILGYEVIGHRQHYLHLHPRSFFAGIENARFQYDMSIGYNDAVGPRAGTYFAYRPYDIYKAKSFSFWEFPLVLMDTTLATTYLFKPAEALLKSKEEMQHVIEAKGCVSIIWHQEQMGGILDPGYDQIYWDLLDELHRRQVRLTTGSRVLPEIDALWQKTLEG
jgi:hypothetical protein